jgi:tetratricopeptide (TPR) repeat protein
MIGLSLFNRGRHRTRCVDRFAAKQPLWPNSETIFFDAAAASSLFVVPVAVGGRHPAGLLALMIGATLAWIAFALRTFRTRHPCWHVGLGECFLVAGTFIGAVQLLSLPESVITMASPGLHGLLPAYTGGAWSLGTWQTLSVTPGETAVGLCILAAQGLFALVVFQFAQSTAAIERLFTVVVAVAALLALHGILQFIGHEGKNFDVVRLSFHEEGGVVKALFRNRNDYAGFLAVAIGPVLWFAFREASAVTRALGHRRRVRRDPAATAPTTRIDGRQLAIGLSVAAIVSFAVFASLSRGGSISLGVGAFVSASLLVRSGHLHPRAGLAIGGMVILMLIAFEIHGLRQIAARMESIFDGAQQTKSFGRREVWEAAWQTMIAFPLTGTGIGSHGDISPLMMPPTGDVRFVHAENSYLNLGVEAGFPAVVIAVLALGLASAASIVAFVHAAPRERQLAAAIAGGLAAGAVNGIGHFNWYVPAISTLMITLGVCALRMAAPHATWLPVFKVPLSRPVAGVLASSVFIILGLLVSREVAATRAEVMWQEARAVHETITRDSQATNREAQLLVATRENRRSQETEDQPDTREAEAEILRKESVILDALGVHIGLLEKVALVRPDHPRVWEELAQAHCDRFGLARRLQGVTMPLEEIRKVASSNRFGSREEVESWLWRAVGKNLEDLILAYDAAKRAVALNPCLGDAWCVLANLAFLESPYEEVPKQCISQAMRVRPFFGTVLYEAARQAQFNGDTAAVASICQKCFAVSPSQRGRILPLLLPLVSAPEAMRLLAPDLDGLRSIVATWAPQSSATDLLPVRERLLAEVLAAAHEAEAPGQAMQKCNLLYEAANLQRALGDPDAAADTLSAALEANPGHHAARLARVDLAIALDDPATAKEHLDWLGLRRPDSRAVQVRIERLQQLRVRLASAHTTPPVPLPPTGARQ